jgi:hypothetical protein
MAQFGEIGTRFCACFRACGSTKIETRFVEIETLKKVSFLMFCKRLQESETWEINLELSVIE